MSTQNPSASAEIPLWQQEYNRRIEAFANAAGLSVQVVQEKFDDFGVDGKDAESLEYLDNPEFLRMNDLFAMFVDNGLSKTVKVRKGESLLRARTSNASAAAETVNGGTSILDAVEKIAKINRPKTDWSDEELLENLEEGNTEIETILNARVKGRPCIVLKSDGTVDVKSSLMLVKIARKTMTGDTHPIDGKLVKVRRLGDWLTKAAEESPVARNTILVDGFCPVTKTNWKDVPQETRVLAHIFMYFCHKGQLDAMSIRTLNRDAMQLSSEGFRSQYADAALAYDDLQSRDELPKLKINPNRSTKDNPF